MRLLISFLMVASCYGAQAFSATTNTLTVTPGVSIPLTGSVSVAVFPTYSQNDGQYHIMFESYSGTPGISSLMLIKGNANTLYLEIDNNGGTVYSIIAASGSFTLPTSAWSVVTGIWTQGGDMFLYLNGMVIASSAASGTPPVSWTGTGAQPWSIGNRATGGFDSRGEVALCGLWNRILTQQEINGLILRFSAKLVAPSGLISSWDLAGASLVDTQSAYNLASSGTTTATDPTHINLGTLGYPPYGAIYE